MKILTIIPARGGSKGIPRKNIIDVCGKPLIAYTIEPALKAKETGIIDEVIVSTDDDEIVGIAREYGASVPFLRPEELSGDKAKSVDLMIHAYNFFCLKDILFDSILLLQPTSPLRTFDDIEKAVSIFKNTDAISLISCYKANIHEYGLYYKAGDRAVGLNTKHNQGIRRQEIEDLYVRNGAFFLVKSDYMIKEKNPFDDKPAMYVMPYERSVNIDTMEDIELARNYLKLQGKEGKL